MNQELLDWFDWVSKSKSEPTTISMTVAEIQQLNHYADRIQVRLDEATRVKGDLLKDNVDRLTIKVSNDGAHADARIRGLKAQINMQNDRRESFWTLRGNFRTGGLKFKKDLQKLKDDATPATQSSATHTRPSYAIRDVECRPQGIHPAWLAINVSMFVNTTPLSNRD